MKVFYSGFKAGRWAPDAVVAIGKFDGMHRAHQNIIRLAVKKAKTLRARCIVLTFDPAPEEFFAPKLYKPLLTLQKKLRILGKLGVDAVLLVPFNEQLACMSPESFADFTLRMQLKAKHIYVGEDFCFGKDRAGTVETLEELGPRFGFSAHAVLLMRVGGEKISASRIRRLIEQGQKKEAEKLLGWKLDDYKTRPSLEPERARRIRAAHRQTGSREGI